MGQIYEIIGGEITLTPVSFPEVLKKIFTHSMTIKATILHIFSFLIGYSAVSPIFCHRLCFNCFQRAANT